MSALQKVRKDDQVVARLPSGSNIQGIVRYVGNIGNQLGRQCGVQLEVCSFFDFHAIFVL